MQLPPLAAVARAALATLLALPLRAQPPARATPITWAELAAAPGAAPAEVAWLQSQLSDEERRELASLVGALSAPAAAQVMASYLQADGSVGVPFTGARALADSLYERPADGPAGLLRVAYLAARLRASTLDGWGRLGVYAADFRPPAAAATPTPRPSTSASGATVRLRFDLAPAESLLAIVGTANVPPADVMPRVTAPAFDALIAHRNQSFYPLPWSGVTGAGPFYSLGAAMSETIARALGPAALAATLPEGGVVFGRRYLDAVARGRGAPSLLTPRVTAAIRAQRADRRRERTASR